MKNIGPASWGGAFHIETTNVETFSAIVAVGSLISNLQTNDSDVA